MSKNLTRKGLALGAIVALGSSVIAGTPALAANELTVAPSAGTSYNTLVTEGLTLETSYAPGVSPLAASQLNYQIKTTTGVVVTAKAASTAAGLTGLQSVVLTADAVDTAAYIGYVEGTSSVATDRNFLAVQLSGVTATSDSKDVVVTAFVDANNDGKLTAGEWNTSKTISFKKYSTVGTTVALTDLATGDTTATGSVQFADINNEQLDASLVKLHFSDAATTPAAHAGVGGAAAFAGLAGVLASSKFSVTTGVLVTAGFTSTTKVGLVAKFAGTEVGTAVTKTASARTISDFAATVDVTDNGLASGVVRTNSSFSVTALIKDVATTPAAKSGVAVKATVTSSVTGAWSTTAGSEQTVTVNGTKYATKAALEAAEFAVTSNADGKATVTIVPANFAAGATFTVTFSAQNYSHAVTATLTDAVYTAAEVQGAAGSYRKIAKNGSATVSYTVKDQFGVASTRTNERLVVSATNAAVLTQYIAVSAGKASFSVAQTTDSAADVVVTSALQISTDTNGSISWANNGTNTVTNTIKTRSAAYAFTVAPAIDATNGINNGAWTVAGAQKQTLTSYDQTDSTLTTGLVSPAASTVWAKVTLTGSNAGEKLTVSGTDVFLSIDGAAAAKNSASKVAQLASAVIYVASTKAGAKTLTVTNGSVSATVVVTFAAATVASRAAVALGDLVTVSQAGRSVDVSAVVTDAFGNVVEGATVTISATGVGYLANTTATSDANGKVAGKLVVGALEAGDAVVTASVTLADATVKTVSKTVSFGATDAQIDIVGKRVTAVASFSKGKTVAFYVDGVKKWSKTSASDADVVLNYNLKKGTHTVTVKISGGFVTTEKFIVR